MRAFDALIGEINGAGDDQRKSGWMRVSWSRRLTWLRWLQSLRSYVADLHTMGTAWHLDRQRTEAEVAMLHSQLRAAEDGRLVDRMNLEHEWKEKLDVAVTRAVLRYTARGFIAGEKHGKSQAAAAIGKLGGSVKSAAKTAAVRENGKKGGWPKGKPRKPKPEGDRE